MNTENRKRAVLDLLKQTVKPEFLNRVDDLVVFDSLGKEQIRSIVEVQIAEVKKLVHSRGITLHVDKGVVDYLAEVGWDPEFGGRPVRRAIQSELQNPLAKTILEGKFQPGAEFRATRTKGNGLEIKSV